jgi:hypothetical protein
MEVYVEKGKVIKKVGSELDTLKEIADWLEKYVDECKGRIADEPVMSMKAGSESIWNTQKKRHIDLIGDYRRWNQWF